MNDIVKKFKKERKIPQNNPPNIQKILIITRNRLLKKLIGGKVLLPYIIPGEKILNKGKYVLSYIKNKLKIYDSGVIDLTDKNVSIINKNSPNNESILFNDFIEGKNNTIRKKKDFVNTTDTLLGDKNIPLSKISTFYGIENGKLKAGPLSSFNDTTTVSPNRAKYIGRVVKYIPKSSLAKSNFRDSVNSEINRYNIKHGYKPKGIYNKLFNSSPREVLKENVDKKVYKKILGKAKEKYNYVRRQGLYPSFITEKGDTIKSMYIGFPKVLFSNEKGESLFASDPNLKAESINNWLSNHPSYPVLVDNGRFSGYLRKDPNVDSYSGYNNPNNMRIIGTVK